jgi:hypothetical protein
VRIDDDTHENAAEVRRAQNVSGAFPQGGRQWIETGGADGSNDFVGRHKAGHRRLSISGGAGRERKSEGENEPKSERKNDPERGGMRE